MTEISEEILSVASLKRLIIRHPKILLAHLRHEKKDLSDNLLQMDLMRFITEARRVIE